MAHSHSQFHTAFFAFLYFDKKIDTTDGNSSKVWSYLN
jgi:hypothetical protein